MRWVAPSEKDTANEVVEKRLWAAAAFFDSQNVFTQCQRPALHAGWRTW